MNAAIEKNGGLPAITFGLISVQVPVAVAASEEAPEEAHDTEGAERC